LVICSKRTNIQGGLTRALAIEFFFNATKERLISKKVWVDARIIGMTIDLATNYRGLYIN